jgi:hypothetical protein
MSKITEEEVTTFKDSLKYFLDNDNDVPNEIIEIAKYIKNNPQFIGNIIETPDPLRCIACCYNKQQCTKNKREGSQYCGIHIKGIPYGIIVQKNDKVFKLDITLTNIKGILCYIDAYNNVYHAEDVIQHKINPKIIARWDGTNYTHILY